MFSCLTLDHSQAAFCVLRYLKGTPGSGIFLAANSILQHKVFSDSDWVSCIDLWHSITGFSIYIGDSLISWRSKKQSTDSRSSSEVEYHALASTSEIQWLTFIHEDFCPPFICLSLLYCDNQSVLQISSNQVSHEHTKHNDINIVREKLTVDCSNSCQSLLLYNLLMCIPRLYLLLFFKPFVSSWEC